MRLRYSIDKARSFSVPKENIERSIKKATGELGARNFEEVIYEGYGPGGVAVLCEALTDNRNRTASELRRLFELAGGNLGASGCVGYLFNFKGLFVIDPKHVAEDRLMEALSMPAPTMSSLSMVSTRSRATPSYLKPCASDWRKSGFPPSPPKPAISRSTSIDLDVENGRKMRKLRDMLDENDDVQNVYANDNIPEEAMAS